MPQSKEVDSPLGAELRQSLDANGRHRMEQILDSLPETDRDALSKVLKKMHEKNGDKSLRSVPHYSYKWLAETLTKHGHAINKHQVRHYMVNIYAKGAAGR